MEILRNVKPNAYGSEGEFFCKLYNKFVRFQAEENVDLNYAEKCVAYFNSLDETIIEKLCQASIRYCNDFLDAIGEPQQQFSCAKDVLNQTASALLIVPLPNETGEPVVHLGLNCDWEQEHGLEWIVRNDKVLYVGAFNDENPWNDFATKQSWNYA